MKLLRSVINCMLIVICSAVFSSCEKKGGNNYNGNLVATLSNDFVESTMASTRINITCAGEWNISADANWVSIGTKKGQGNASVPITVSSNNVPGLRKSDITVKAGRKTTKVTLTQVGNILTVSSDNVAFGQYWATHTITIISRSAWAIENADDAPWCDFSATSGIANIPLKLILTPKIDGDNMAKSPVTISVSNTAGETASFQLSRGAFTGYENKSVMVVQENSIPGANPVHLIVMGDGFTPGDYSMGGNFDQLSQNAIDAFFSLEPMKAYRNYFKISKVAAWSQDSGVTIENKITWGNKEDPVKKNTVFESKIEGGGSTSVSANFNKVFEYAGLAASDLTTVKPVIMLILNNDIYAGTCYMYSDGRSVAISGLGLDPAGTIIHETAGHGLGRLADEYVNEPNKTIPEVDIQSIVSWRQGNPWSYKANVTFSNDPQSAIWKHYFPGNPNYNPKYTGVGLFEGGEYYGRGVWRPEVRSCMINNIRYFNAPSREAIVRRIMSIAGKTFNLNSFYDSDVHNPPAAGSRSAQETLGLPPLAHPVMMK